MTDLKTLCPCSNGNSYDTCCRPFHLGELPQNALELMRSRYSAYALNLPDYIVATTHPASRQYSDNKFSWKLDISRFSRSSIFHKLKILDFKENKSVATVVFTAYISQDDSDVTFTEKSCFEKLNDRWLYRTGHLEKGHAPDLIIGSELRLLPLAYYGLPILRKRADPISEITDEIKNLAEAMIETMDASGGIGLAAPQVQHSLRLFVVRSPLENSTNTFEAGDVHVYLNPKLSSPSKETWIASEGCLSIPTIRAPVVRPKNITIEYTSLKGEAIKKEVSGWEARVIMHENDHLNGILFIDRLSDEEKLKIQPLLKNLEKRINNASGL